MKYRCFRIYEKLMVHSDLSKAESWVRLTEEFLNSPLPNTDGIKVWLDKKHTAHRLYNYKWGGGGGR